MGLTEFCLKKPVLITVAVIFLMLAGVWALLSIPIQLTPDVEHPKITVRTYWPGASPYEIEREIVQKQEEFLNNLPGLRVMNSSSQPDRANITLEFEIGTDMDAALLRITNELNQVSSYPENALRPTIILSGANSQPTVWSQVRAMDGNPRDIRTFKQWTEDNIKPELEKIHGISEARVYGGRDAEVQVRLDPARLSLHGISINQVQGRIRSEIGDISGGTLTEGKREYTIRSLSPFRTPEDLGKMIVKTTPTGAVYLRNVAEVGIGYNNQGSSVLGNHGRALMVPIYKEPGANVLELTEEVEQSIARLNAGLLKENGLTMEMVSDPGFYIRSAIDLVLSNIYLGGFLAVVVLYLFLGNFRSALVIAFAIPVSVVGTFLFMKLLGRNINVISLAGLAFAVGMVMDAAIVVLENIDKWRARGVPLLDAVVKGTGEVYGAILASSLTTVAVFLPVVFVQDQAGQLFRDIAIAICVAILLSFAVSTVVIPPLYRFLFSSVKADGLGHAHHVNAATIYLEKYAEKSVDFLVALLNWLHRSHIRKWGLIVGTLVLAVVVTWALMPKKEYLPGGNRNLLISILFPPPGYNPDETEAMGQRAIAGLGPAIRGELKDVPAIERIFFVGFGTTLVLGVVAKEPARLKELIPFVKKVLAREPGMIAITSQTSLFERGLGAGNSIDVEIYGHDLSEVGAVVQKLNERVKGLMPGAQIRPIPSYELSQPEIRITPILERAAAAGLTARELGLIVDIYTDGRKIGDFSLPNGQTLDLKLKAGDQFGAVRDVALQPLLAPNGTYVTLGSVADVEETVGPVEIARINQKRVFMLRVKPPPNLSLEEALEILQFKLAIPAQAEFASIPGLRIELSGTADAFKKTWSSLQTGFVLAIAITFLLLVILFEDLLSPFVIMVMLPVAGAGGMIGLWLINALVTEQALDMLTMLGFLMMIGIVVNNPILIVSMALGLMREQGMVMQEAIILAVKSRIRPIFMTTFTSVGGLMPLVLMPGAGSELYRGLGSAVLGGLVLSTFVNMIFVPTLFSILQDLVGLVRPRKAGEGDQGAVPQLARGA